MAVTIDHLKEHHEIRVTREFVDHQGVLHPIGESGVIQRLGFDWGSQSVVIEWIRGGTAETMRFPLANSSGPGNGRMQDYFEIGDYVDPAGPEKLSGDRKVATRPSPQLPDVVASPIQTHTRYDEAIERIWALAGRRRFAEAEEQLQAILNAPDRVGDNACLAAESLCALALAHGYDEDQSVHRWLRERGISLWYAWGSGATSGGEGAARALEIRAAEAKFAALDQQRQQRSS